MRPTLYGLPVCYYGDSKPVPNIDPQQRIIECAIECEHLKTRFSQFDRPMISYTSDFRAYCNSIVTLLRDERYLALGEADQLKSMLDALHARLIRFNERTRRKNQQVHDWSKEGF